MSNILGRIHSVETFGALDGPGIRYILFLQGCPLRCIYCHNADTWTTETDNVISPEQAMTDILRYKNFISGGGVTISGGEPLIQAEFCEELIRLCHEHNIHCAIDTSGGVPLKYCEGAINAADMILLDIKSLNPNIIKSITGKDQLYFKEILDYCEKSNKEVWIRHVIVPNLTLKDDLLRDTAKFISGYNCVKNVELLPFHKMGEYKWRELNMTSPLFNEREPTQEEVNRAKQVFRDYNIYI